METYPEDTPLSKLSGGERTRAALAGVIAANPGVLLLDEPTNHLDIAALEWLESYLSVYSGAALVASHDRAFLDGVATGILELGGRAGGIASYPGGYYRVPAGEGARAGEAVGGVEGPGG